MKILLVALNSKFIHSCPAVWYLKAGCTMGQTTVLEFTVNDSTDRILAAIVREKADIIAFSCYIWNIDYVLHIASDIKKICPKTVIVLGGPEVSYDAHNIMLQNTYINCIVCGEGEAVFARLIDAIGQGSTAMEDIQGIVYRKGGSVYSNEGYSVLQDLQRLPFAFTEEFLDTVQNRIIYYESSRGCPFSCSYCLSSAQQGVRYIPLERVKRELMLLVQNKPRQIKFVDRTFNCRADRAYSIFEYIIENFGGRTDINFHFEANGDLFDNRLIKLLYKAPPGLIQFEIGVQSTNRDTLLAVNRKTDMQRLADNVKKIVSKGNIHLHLDLIAGLPEETMQTFRRSFNDVYNMKPDTLQIGFLKMLKGSPVRKDALAYGYRYRDYPPYEVLSGPAMSFEDISVIKGVEEVLNRYFNRAHFKAVLEYIAQQLENDMYEFFLSLSRYNEENGYLFRPADDRKLYVLLQEFIVKKYGKAAGEKARELLRFDYIASHGPGRIPQHIKGERSPFSKEACSKFFKKEDNIKRYLRHYAGMALKNISTRVHFEEFSIDVADTFEKVASGYFLVLFDLHKRDTVTGRLQVLFSDKIR